MRQIILLYNNVNTSNMCPPTEPSQEWFVWCPKTRRDFTETSIITIAETATCRKNKQVYSVNVP